MKLEHDELLLSKYRDLFGTSVNAFRFACGDGWYPLISALLLTIKRRVDASKGEVKITVMQVKEKFGALRFYYDGGDEFIHGAVGLAEQLSAHTCEECGAFGTVSGRYWLRCLCPAHTQERDKREAERGSEEES